MTRKPTALDQVADDWVKRMAELSPIFATDIGVAGGEGTGSQWLKKFYFGEPGHHGLREILDNIGDIDPRELNTFRIGENGAAIRVGKYGPYIEVTNPDAAEDEKPRIVNIPLDMAPDELTPEKVQELIDAPIVTGQISAVGGEWAYRAVAKAAELVLAGEADAIVTGIDMGEAPLAVARLHLLETGATVEYVRSTAEDMAALHPLMSRVSTALEQALNS
mgnify:CR=1 FL=1